jgi:hypothetical protein
MRLPRASWLNHIVARNRVLLAVYMLADEDGVTCLASNLKIKQRTGLCPHAVSRSMHELEASGAIAANCPSRPKPNIDTGGEFPSRVAGPESGDDGTSRQRDIWILVHPQEARDVGLGFTSSGPTIRDPGSASSTVHSSMAA